MRAAQSASSQIAHLLKSKIFLPQRTQRAQRFHLQNTNRHCEPPDAIITINGEKTWIEITDAFFINEIAESITSHVAEDKIHKPVLKEQRRSFDPDGEFSEVLKKVIIQKYDKPSIRRVYEKYGSGILLVGIINPFSNAEELVSCKKIIMNEIKSKEQIFNEIYLYDMNKPDFFKWL